MRPVHFGLGLIAAGVAAIGFFESRPDIADFDPDKHAAFRQTWDQRVHIAYWEKWGGFEAEAAQEMVRAFNESQDRIFVHYLRTSEVDRKSMLAIIGGNPPDVIGIWGLNIPPFAAAGALMSLDEFRRGSGMGDDLFVEHYLDICTYKGTTYAMPNTPASIGLFWNKEHFRAKADELRTEGLDPTRPPRTIAELDRYAAVLTKFNPDGTPETMGFLPTEPGWFHMAWAYHFGGRLVDPATGKVTTDSPENIRAFEWIKRYAERYGRERVLKFRSGFGNYDSPQNPFVDGKLSMIMQGVWFPAFVSRHRPHMEYGAAPFPTAGGVPGPRGLLQCDVLAIPVGCPHPDEAWEFLKFVQTGGEYVKSDGERVRTPPGLATICRLQGKHLPIRKAPEWFEDEYGMPFDRWFRQGHPNPFLDTFEELARSPYSFHMPQNLIWQEYNQEITQAFEHIWSWPVPPEALEGLRGEARQRKVRELCRQEIVETLRGVRIRMQRKLDQRRARRALRSERAEP